MDRSVLKWRREDDEDVSIVVDVGSWLPKVRVLEIPLLLCSKECCAKGILVKN